MAQATSSPDSQWAQFQRSANGRHCFYFRKRQGDRDHDSALNFTVADGRVTLLWAGILKMGASQAFYAEEHTVERKGSVIVATHLKSSETVEIQVSGRQLSVSHWLTHDKTTYAMGTCRAKQAT
jgi:hypothetical protein